MWSKTNDIFEERIGLRMQRAKSKQGRCRHTAASGRWEVGKVERGKDHEFGIFSTTILTLIRCS